MPVTKILACVLILAMSRPSLAQQPLPVGIVPLNGEVILRLTPKHEARCTQNKHEKKPGEFFGTRSTMLATSEVFEGSRGEVKYSIVIGDALNYFRMTFDVNDDGSVATSREPEFQTNMKVADKDQQELDALKQMLGRLIEQNANVIGTPLRQGTFLQYDFCRIFPGASRTEKLTGGYSVLGTTTVLGRESVILSVQQSQSCSLPGTTLNMEIKGWWAIDRQSGLTAGMSAISAASVTARTGSFTSAENHECKVTGAPTKAAQPPTPDPGKARSSEQRLLELKSLLDKGLITNEQYDQKRAEILKAL